MPPRIDVMILGAGHSILASHIPGKINAQQFSADFYKATQKTKESLDKYGLFGGGNNYATFYPDANPRDFNPAEDEFIEPVYRLLSACIVAKPYNPTEFTEAVLKDAMHLLVGQTVNCDHETDVANAIGSIKEVSWQDSYEVDGITIPGGINGVLRIDGKSNPRIARGINMDPPSIHSNSVTVRFEWKPSHSFEKEWEFYDKLGTIAEDGTMVRKVVTKIISFMETSLVSHGADPFAQKVVDGKIINPAYAGATYAAFKDLDPKEVSNHIYDMDFKMYNQWEPQKETIHNTSQVYIEKNNPIHNSDMNELQQFLEQVFGQGYLTLAEGEKPSVELALSGIKNLITEKQTLSEANTQAESTITELREKITDLEGKISLNERMATIGTAHLSEVRNATIEAYKKLQGEEKVDQNILALLEADTTNLETLISLKATYEAQLNEKFPLHCADCGSHNVNRGSSVDEPEDEEKRSLKEDTSIVDTLADIAKDKYKNKK